MSQPSANPLGCERPIPRGGPSVRTGAGTALRAGGAPWLLLGSVLLAAGCAGGPEPETGPRPASEVSASVDSAAPEPAAEPVDEETVEEAREQAEASLARLEENTRREFVELFGTDPLGLARVPANAVRYEIPLETNAAVERWLRYFTEEIPDRFALYLRRAGRYAPMIREKLRAAGLPEDLLYLSLIESGMNSHAYSWAHAVGLWQFISSTARLYDLEVNYWVDERRHPEKATDAAIEFLSDLYDEFGSWYLAAAAYNGGPGRVRYGLSATGGGTFWDMYDARVLRSETRNYVPKLIAAALIGHDPAMYGFTDIEPLAPVPYDTVTVPDATSLDVLAEAAGATEEAIEELNPHLRRRVTPPDEEFTLRVPAGHAEGFAANYAEIPPSERVTWTVHTVTRGQTLSGIAARYGTSVAAIRAANRGVSPRRLQIGQRLVVPRAAAPRAAATLAFQSRESRGSDGTVQITVRRGDTLWAIARAYDVSTRDLMEWNGLSSPVIRPGDRLTVNR